jgi:hypothetical protein
MTTRLVRMTVTALLLAGAAACGLGGGGTSNPCAGPADNEPPTFAVSSSNVNDPDVLRGCLDDGLDGDIFDLTGQDIGTGTFSIQCFAATGVAEFDTPASSDYVACTPGGSPVFVHNAVTATDVGVRTQVDSAGGEYRLEIVVA